MLCAHRQFASLGNMVESRDRLLHSRAPIPVYILGRFCSYMNIHYTPTLQNIHYTTYIPTLIKLHLAAGHNSGCTRFWPLRAAARSTHERGGTGHRTMVETRVVHEYQ